ncbi:MAG: alpha/beta fold hydrolase [Planctomycetota bacterium]|nr:alpha/beta fold hydrolase [Planctomycetota bacterium]
MKAKINGCEMYYEVHGSGEPVLLVHGFPLSGRMWEPVVDGLAGTHRLIIPDLRGLGRSAATAETTMVEYVDDLVGLLRTIGERRPVVLVGHSMGGYVAFEFVRNRRERLRGLVLTCTRAVADSEEAARGREETAATVLRDGSKVIADSMINKLFAPTAPDGLRETWRGIMAATAPVGAAAALIAMKNRSDSNSTLGQIELPTLLVAGREDVISPPDEVCRIHEGIAGSRFEVIEKAGHMAPLEQPVRFVELLRSFLDDLAAAG